MQADPKALRKEAKRLAKTGQPVFPCRTGGERAKTPYTKNGVKDATTDLDQIKRWWRQYPDAAIGVATGIKWDVLDVDTKGVDGRQHLPYLHRVGLLNGCQHVARTPSGGWHLYFPAEAGNKNRQAAALGLDMRSKGGYVLAPPSVIHSEDSSGAYEMMGPTTGANTDPLLWDLILSALTPTDEESKEPVALLPSERWTSVAHLREWLLNRQKGERNNAFHWAVCRCLDSRIDPEELVDVALDIGLTEHEIKATIGSAMKRMGLRPGDLVSEAESMFG